jgi:hypothetical protein
MLSFSSEAVRPRRTGIPTGGGRVVAALAKLG